jgi:hypothetical protein
MQDRPSWGVKNSSIRRESSLQCLHHPASYTYSDPVQSAPYLLIAFIWTYFFIFLSHLRLWVPSCLFPSRVPKTMYPFLLNPMHATFPAHLLLDFITRVTFHEEHKPHIFSLGNSLQLPVFHPPPPLHQGTKQPQLIFFLSRDYPSSTSMQIERRNILGVFYVE